MEPGVWVEIAAADFGIALRPYSKRTSSEAKELSLNPMGDNGPV